jgi:rubrerythrin
VSHTTTSTRKRTTRKAKAGGLFVAETPDERMDRVLAPLTAEWIGRGGGYKVWHDEPCHYSLRAHDAIAECPYCGGTGRILEPASS